MRYLKELIIVLALFLLIGNVSAEDSYDVTLTILRPDNIYDLENTTWSKYDEITIDKDERVTSIHKIMILDVSLNTDTIFVEVIKNGERFTNFIKEGEEVLFGNEDELDFKIKVNSVELETLNGDSNTVINDDDVVVIWIAPNSVEKLFISPFIPESFNPSAYGKTAGWSGTGSVECVNLYIERVQSVNGVAISIVGGDWEEINIDNVDKRKFELKENAVYIITVDYQQTDSWGGVKDETDIYTISLSGLKYGINTGSTTSGVSTSTYEDRMFNSFSNTVDKYIIVETDADGTWEEINGCTVKFDAKTTSGKYSWKIKFDDSGSHKVGFSGINGVSGFYRFDIRAKTPAPVSTLVAEQTVTDDGESNNIGTILGIFGVLILVSSIAVFLNKKSRNKGNNNSGGSRISPDTPT